MRSSSPTLPARRMTLSTSPLMVQACALTALGIRGAVQGLTAGTWYKIAVKKSGTSLYIRVNKTLAATHTIAGTFTPGQFVMGSVSGLYPNADYAFLKIWDGALSDTDLDDEADYADPGSVNLAALRSWFEFKTGALATDSSGNGRNLTSAGSPSFVNGPAGWDIGRRAMRRLRFLMRGWGESVAVRVTLGVPDAGAGADGLNGSASMGLVDGGAGADLVAQVLAMLGLAGAGAGVDLAQVAATLGLSDAGSGADALAQVRALLLRSDTGTGSDAIAGIVAAVAGADLGTGSDAVAGVAATLGLSDAGVVGRTLWHRCGRCSCAVIPARAATPLQGLWRRSLARIWARAAMRLPVWRRQWR